MPVRLHLETVVQVVVERHTRVHRGRVVLVTLGRNRGTQLVAFRAVLERAFVARAVSRHDDIVHLLDGRAFATTLSYISYTELSQG